MIPRPELVELVIRRRDDHPDAHAVLCAGETVTWSQLSDRMWRAANALLGAGVVPGDRVALCLGNSPDFLAVYLGLVAIGAAPVPVNVAQRGPSLRHILEHSGTVAAVVEAGLDAAIRAAWPEHQLRIIRRGGPDFEPFRSGPVDEPGIDIGGRAGRQNAQPRRMNRVQINGGGRALQARAEGEGSREQAEREWNARHETFGKIEYTATGATPTIPTVLP